MYSYIGTYRHICICICICIFIYIGMSDPQGLGHQWVQKVCHAFRWGRYDSEMGHGVARASGCSLTLKGPKHPTVGHLGQTQIKICISISTYKYIYIKSCCYGFG